MMQDIRRKLNPGVSRQEQLSTRRLKVKEETSKMLDLKHSFVWG
jgi:hypothetical protein